MKSTDTTTLKLRNLTLGYKNRTLFEGVDLDFVPGAMTAIIGRNGTGKSTLLRCMAAIDKPQKGQVMIGRGDDFSSIHGLDVSQRACLLSFVSTERITLAGLKVETVVGFGLAPYTDIFGRLDAEHHKIIDDCLEAVGMSSFVGKSIDTLSDGERTRVMIARALAQNTPVIVLDEPTAFLDLPNKYEISALLATLTKKMGKTVIFTTHDLDVALGVSDRFVVIEDGAFVEGSPREIVSGGSIERMLGDSTKYLGNAYFELKNQ